MKPLSQFSDKHLYDRLQGLAKNLFFDNGKLRIASDVGNAFRETHADALRRGPIPALDVERLIKPTDPFPIYHHEKSVVRYSSRQHLEELRAGHVSFGPAKTYKDLKNAAQNDDELKRTWHLPDTILKIAGYEYPASELVVNQPIQENGGEFIHHHSLFMSLEESPKLQRAFEAEGYVVINDYTVFLRAIVDAIRAKLGHDEWGSRQNQYYDDRIPQKMTKVTEMVFKKSIAFNYQREVRLVVFNAPDREKRLPFDVSWPPGLISTVRSF